MPKRELPLVLVPGHMCDARLFAAQVAVCDDRSTSVGDLTADATIEAMAQRVLGSAPPYFALLGLSMGGIVALEMVRQMPERVARLALLDTNPFPESADRSTQRLELIGAVAAGDLERVVTERLKPAYLAGANRENKPLLDLIVSMALDLGSSVFDRQARALLSRPDSRPVLEHVRVPTLVLCGREDALCPVSDHEMMASAIPGAILVIVEAAGHLPTLERPDAVNMAMRSWLES